MGVLYGLPRDEKCATLAVSDSTKTAAAFPSPGIGLLLRGLAGDFDALEFFEGGFDLCQIKKEHAANADAWNDSAGNPIPDGTARDSSELFSEFTDGDEFGRRRGGWSVNFVWHNAA
jgi:hypothetical protein